jgi:alkylation response protein AidB-like acyl-CoA dehydrogenase
MDLKWSADDLAFRDEIRSFLDQKLTPELQRAGRLKTSVYSHHEAGMLAQHYIFSRSRHWPARRRCPRWAFGWWHTRSSPSGRRRRRTTTPGILTGDVFFCQGYSKPEAGSDLASLSMSAVDDGDDLVCTGSKIWTIHAAAANWMFAQLTKP